MNPETYLVNHPFGEKIKMTHAINVPLSPECHYFKKVGEVLNFTLIFPKIPLSWDAFDLKELSGELFAFTVKDIERNHSGIYRVEVGQY